MANREHVQVSEPDVDMSGMGDVDSDKERHRELLAAMEKGGAAPWQILQEREA